MTRSSRLRGGQSWANRYRYDQLSENTDETEWIAVTQGTAHVSAGTVDDSIAETGDDLTPERVWDDRLQGVEMIQEGLQGTVAEQLAERAELLGALYPFQITGNTLRYVPAELPLYETLLGICQSPSLTHGAHTALPRMFEHLCVLAGRSYLGDNAQGYRSGWPRPTQNAARFKAMLAEIHQQTGRHAGEWQWAPSAELPDDPLPANIKENGLDVVLWRPWRDMRGGQFYLFGQCACGGNWLDKFKDLSVERLRDWAPHLTHVPPMRGFFTPRFAVKSVLTEASKEAGLVFDRVRMMYSLTAQPIHNDMAAMRDQLHDCVRLAQTPVD